MKLMLFGMFFLGQVFACDCRSPVIQIALNTADTVFSGQVEKIEIIGLRPGLTKQIGFIVRIFTFRVEKVWKGEDVKILKLFDLDTDDCTMNGFDVGQEYIVFAQTIQTNALKKEIWGQLPGYGKSILTSRACSRTALLQEAKDDIAFLKRHYANLNSK